MDTRFNLNKGLLLGVLAVALLTAPSAHSFTLNGAQLTEDFSTDDFADYTVTTGVWNTVAHTAQAGAVANGDPARPITFGDGSDGVLDSSNGAVFDTNGHPNGYNYKSVNITGGTITVTGTNALVIRSLTSVTLGAGVTFTSLIGGAGSGGVFDVTTLGPGGGANVTCLANGAAGGNATAILGSNGGDPFKFDGTTEVGRGGAGNTGGASANSPLGALTRPGVNFDIAGGFVCGSGGGGGGGHAPNAVDFGVGGAGGAGGGRVQITSIGDLTVTPTVDASGGASGAGVSNGAVCSGNGGGGNGGAVWFQALGNLNAANPTVGAGAGAVTACNAIPVNGLPGRTRGDGAAATGAMALTFTTANVAGGQSFIVQSKAYDLNTLNAVFSNQASVNSVANAGSVSVSFAGSVDGNTFSNFTTDITTLSNQSYRYLKFQVHLTTQAGASPPGVVSPTVSQISLGYSDAGLPKLNLKLSGGCGTITNVNRNSPEYKKAVLQTILFWMMAFALGYRLLRHGFVKAVKA